MKELKTAVRVYLASTGNTYESLAEIIRDKSGKYCDKSLIANALSGKKSVPWLIQILEEMTT